MRLYDNFFERDVLEVAPELIGKIIVLRRDFENLSFVITEVEAYRGTEDQASHARFGKTSRNAIMFESGGRIYVYFIYGMYWMINIVTGIRGQPQAVLIRGIDGIKGPGKVARTLGIDKSFYGENLTGSDRIWIEDSGLQPAIVQQPRYGINYAGEPWKSMPWRYIMAPPSQISGSVPPHSHPLK
jgi:DNA-3-methyladenine glycosylase